ncbi:hypothetical protein ACKKBG_A14150 [Auxenochlorella protothecoides x Auxenochlorella symbiontica]
MRRSLLLRTEGLVPAPGHALRAPAARRAFTPFRPALHATRLARRVIVHAKPRGEHDLSTPQQIQHLLLRLGENEVDYTETKAWARHLGIDAAGLKHDVRVRLVVTLRRALGLPAPRPENSLPAERQPDDDLLTLLASRGIVAPGSRAQTICIANAILLEEGWAAPRENADLALPERDWRGLTVMELRDECRLRGLQLRGTKAELVASLEAWHANGGVRRATKGRKHRREDGAGGGGAEDDGRAEGGEGEGPQIGAGGGQGAGLGHEHPAAARSSAAATRPDAPRSPLPTRPIQEAPPADLQGLSAQELRAALAQRGLPQTGRRDVLLTRLTRALGGDAGGVAARQGPPLPTLLLLVGGAGPAQRAAALESARWVALQAGAGPGAAPARCALRVLYVGADAGRTRALELDWRALGAASAGDADLMLETAPEGALVDVPAALSRAAATLDLVPNRGAALAHPPRLADALRALGLQPQTAALDLGDVGAWAAAPSLRALPAHERLAAWVRKLGAAPAVARLALRAEAGGQVLGGALATGAAQALVAAAGLAARHDVREVVVELVRPGVKHFVVSVLGAEGRDPVALPITQVGHYDLLEEMVRADLALHAFTAVRQGADPGEIGEVVSALRREAAVDPCYLGGPARPTQELRHSTPAVDLADEVQARVRAAALKLYAELGLHGPAQFRGWVTTPGGGGEEEEEVEVHVPAPAELEAVQRAGADAQARRPRAFGDLLEFDGLVRAAPAQRAPAPESITPLRIVGSTAMQAAAANPELARAMLREELTEDRPSRARYGAWQGLELDDRVAVGGEAAEEGPCEEDAVAGLATEEPLPPVVERLVPPSELDALPALCAPSGDGAGAHRIGFSRLTLGLDLSGARSIWLQQAAAAGLAPGRLVCAGLAQGELDPAALAGGAEGGTVGALAAGAATRGGQVAAAAGQGGDDDGASPGACVPAAAPWPPQDWAAQLRGLGSFLENLEVDDGEGFEAAMAAAGVEVPAAPGSAPALPDSYDALLDEREGWDERETIWGGDSVWVSGREGSLLPRPEDAGPGDAGAGEAWSGEGGHQATPPDPAPAARTPLWVLFGGDGAGGEASLRSGLEAAAALGQTGEYDVRSFFLEPCNAGEQAEGRRSALLQRRLQMLKLGADDDELLREMGPLHPTRINMPPKSELVALQRGVWELTGTGLLRQTPAELQHACERALAQYNTPWSQRGPDRLVPGQAAASQAAQELVLGGWAAPDEAAAIWGAGLEAGERTPQPSYRFLDRWAAAAHEAGAVVVLACQAQPVALGPIQRVLESKGVPCTLSSSATLEAVTDRAVMMRQLADLEPHGVSAAPWHKMSLAELSAKVEGEAEADALFDQLRGFLGAGEADLVLRPACTTRGPELGQVTITCGADLAIVAAALSQGREAIEAGELGQGDGVRLPQPPPSHVLLEPDVAVEDLILMREPEGGSGDGSGGHGAGGRGSVSARLALPEGWEEAERSLPPPDPAQPGARRHPAARFVHWPPGEPSWVAVRACLVGGAGHMVCLGPTADVLEVAPRPAGLPRATREALTHVSRLAAEEARAAARALGNAAAEVADLEDGADAEAADVEASSDEEEEAATVVGCYQFTPPPERWVSGEAAAQARLRLQLVAGRLGLSGAASMEAFVHTATGEVVVTEVDPLPDLSLGGLLMKQAAAGVPQPLTPAQVWREVVRAAQQGGGGAGGAGSATQGEADYGFFDVADMADDDLLSIDAAAQAQQPVQQRQGAGQTWEDEGPSWQDPSEFGAEAFL